MKLRLMKMPQHGVIAAYLALFLALGGTAYAANSIRSIDIVDGEVKAQDIGVFPHIVVGDSGPDQTFTPGSDAAVRFGAANTSRSGITKDAESTGFIVTQPGLYQITGRLPVLAQGICSRDSTGGSAYCRVYAIAKIVKYVGGSGPAVVLGSDQDEWVNDALPGVYKRQFDLYPTTVAKLGKGDRVAVLFASDWVDGTVAKTSPKILAQPSAAQPLFTMVFISK